jgi:hypothetical protein
VPRSFRADRPLFELSTGSDRIDQNAAIFSIGKFKHHKLQRSNPQTTERKRDGERPFILDDEATTIGTDSSLSSPNNNNGWGKQL